MFDNLNPTQLKNLLSILEYADIEAETFERRDALRVQQQIEEIRQRLNESKIKSDEPGDRREGY